MNSTINLLPPTAVKEKIWKIYGPFEVIIHNTADDCWISFLGKVYDVTPLIKLHKGEDCIKPLLAFAGKDLTNWFDEETRDIQYYVHPITGVSVPFCPHGLIPEVQYPVPTTLWRPYETPPWWLSEKYQIGILTKSVRPLKIINMLIGKEVYLNVCCEDTFFRIRERYSMFNSEADSYTWVYMDKVIDMSKTMDENGIPDERDKMADLGIPRSLYTPSVRLYYNDDLKHIEELTDDEDEFLNEVCCDCKALEEKAAVKKLTIQW